jgi:hypothetical protein
LFVLLLLLLLLADRHKLNRFKLRHITHKPSTLNQQPRLF